MGRTLLDGRGLKITVPANGTEQRTLRVYVGVRGTTTVGTLSANFGSDPAVTQRWPGNSATALVARTFTITYRPRAASDTLNVSFVQTAGGSATGSAVVLYAAALY